MRSHAFRIALAACSFALAPLPAAFAQCPDDALFTSEFPLADCTWAADGGNPFFSIEPGDWLLLEGEDDGEAVAVEITVLDARRSIGFRLPSGERLRVQTRVVREREWVDGELVEISRNYFARCKETNDIYYFGEDVDIFEEDGSVSHEGAWLAGVDGALPGIIMPGTFLLGARYFQEQAPDVAMDRAEHTAMDLVVEVAAGEFEGCVEVTETTSLDCGEEGTKLYCPGVGLVVDADAELVDYSVGDDDDDADDEDQDPRGASEQHRLAAPRMRD